MPHLKPCIYRGMQVEDNHVFCGSEDVHEQFVPMSTCESCPLAEAGKIRGVGDVLHKAIKATGLDKLTRGKKCGCQKRREWLNKAIPNPWNESTMTCDNTDTTLEPEHITRNLMMHIWPVKEHGFWRWNVEQLLKRIGLFNGVRSVAIVIDDLTNSAEDVISAFGSTRLDNVFVEQNEPHLREVKTWRRLMDSCFSCDPNTLTFTCHAKGVRGDHWNSDHPINRWATVMYGACLDGYNEAEHLLQNGVSAGNFRKYLNWGGGSWHYSGTFYWFRNSRLFAIPNWWEIPQTWMGTEVYPGTKWKKGGVIFGRGVGDLYQPETWESLWPKWLKWKEAHILK